jgi:hypothetical protein
MTSEFSENGIPFEVRLKNPQYSKDSVIALVNRPYYCRIGYCGPETRAKATPTSAAVADWQVT